ncbi:protein of unknown function [Thauera humireducens]|nr:protein of unknown function [Thauera humireducens]
MPRLPMNAQTAGSLGDQGYGRFALRPVAPRHPLGFHAFAANSAPKSPLAPHNSVL